MNEYVVTIDSKKFTVKFLGRNELEINGKKINAELAHLGSHAYLLKINSKPFEAALHKKNSDRIGLLIEGWYYDCTIRSKLQQTASEIIAKSIHSKRAVNLTAPMPGLVLKIKKQIGDAVEVGEPILLLEAMKMENEIRSTSHGVVKEIKVKEGDSIEKGGILLIIE